VKQGNTHSLLGIIKKQATPLRARAAPQAFIAKKVCKRSMDENRDWRARIFTIYFVIANKLQ
jgi:hypothetical protein